MPGWFEGMAFWHWWILAAVLLLLELANPRFLFLWVAIGAVAIGFLILLFPGLPLLAQGVIFMVFSLTATLIWKR